MKKASVQVTVNILEKEFRIACAPEERDDLMRAAHYLSDQMLEIRETGRLIGLDRVAIMAALNITNELLQQKAKGGANGSGENPQIGSRLRQLQQKVESALNTGRQMEF